MKPRGQRRRSLVVVGLLSLLGPGVVAEISTSGEQPIASRSPATFRRKRNSLSHQAVRELRDNTDKSVGSFSRRRGQETEACSLCGNYTLFSNALPHYHFLDENGEPLPKGTSCLEFSDFAQGALTSDSLDCYGLKASLLHGCCDAPPRDNCESKLRSETLEGYDSAVMPANMSSPSHPLDITIQLDFYHITDLDIKSSTVEIFVWLWLEWTDHRLAWDVDEHCAYDTTYRASMDAEQTEIWVPDVDLYNQELGAQRMPESSAEVYSDGTVVWRRNGGLKALCLFSGLRRMPFDTLGCRYLMGSWTRMNAVNLILADGTGFELGNFLAKYAEYRLIPNRVKTGRVDISKTGEGISGVHYDFYFERAQRFYVVGIVVPSILFTVLSFGMFLLDLRVGERLSYGMALLLVLAAHQIVTTSYLPVTEERLWATVLINASFYWVVFGLLESVLVGYLFFTGYDADNQHDHNGMLEHHTLFQPRQANRRVPDVIGDEESDVNDMDVEESQMNVRSSGRPAVSYSTRPGLSVRTLKQSMMVRKRDTNTNRKLIRSIDKWCFRVVPVSYLIFLIVFFATLPLWEETGEDVWAPVDEL